MDRAMIVGKRADPKKIGPPASWETSMYLPQDHDRSIPDMSAGRFTRPVRPPASQAPRVRSEVVGRLAAMLASGPFAGRRTVAQGAAGVLLSQSDLAADLYDISLVHADGRGPTVLVSAQDDSAVVAQWRKTALSLGLPLLVMRDDGEVLQPYEHCGAVTVGPFRYRRRNATLSRRRPRFLQRRKCGRLPERPLVRRERDMSPDAWTR
jgi:hypothetical protein